MIAVHITATWIQRSTYHLTSLRNWKMDRNRTYTSWVYEIHYLKGRKIVQRRYNTVCISDFLRVIFFCTIWRQAPCPDVYRGKYRNDSYKNEDLAATYAQDVKSICDALRIRGKGVSAFISESLMSVGGQILPPQDYYRHVYKSVWRLIILTYSLVY